MTRAEEYRERAQEAEARAAVARDPEVKFIFAESARQWRRLADQWERMTTPSLSPG
jgi:hypothetical protein